MKETKREGGRRTSMVMGTITIDEWNGREMTDDSGRYELVLV